MLGYLYGKRFGSKIALKFPPHRGEVFLISTFRHVLNVVCFPLGNSPASEFYMPTFRAKLFPNNYPSISQTYFILHTSLPMKMEHSVPKRRNIKFGRRRFNQKKEYNIQNTAKVWNQLLHFINYEWIEFVNACCHLVQDLFHSSPLSESAKINVHRTMIFCCCFPC